MSSLLKMTDRNLYRVHKALIEIESLYYFGKTKALCFNTECELITYLSLNVSVHMKNSHKKPALSLMTFKVQEIYLIAAQKIFKMSNRATFKRFNKKVTILKKKVFCIKILEIKVFYMYHKNSENKFWNI